MLILTINPSKYKGKEDFTYLISKITIFKDTTSINLLNLSKLLNLMNIPKLNVFSIFSELDNVSVVTVEEPTCIKYIEIGADLFIKHINRNDLDFKDYNKNSLYIIRNGSYMDVKNIFTKINGYNSIVGRGGSQKAHMVSPLDLRLSSYLLAMFNFDHKYISGLNSFNDADKNRYLPYK